MDTFINLFILAQAKRTLYLIEDLEQKTSKLSFNYMQVELISLQVFLQDLRFSVLGCLPMDWTLMRIMLAATASYLVILYQFSNEKVN
ncbi:hypothetical protein PPYR_03824 [Photinus pyralis]|uniref:Gustatory receptor n=1 Tax=Photinus pyralis TaxID=7054 RepID=A0A5N4AWM7_PHOPY|nr:hypothetical protein PPYR_03824 [Photinus pyralis]